MDAIRLTFDVVAKELTLRSASRLKMRVPPEQKIRNMGVGSGLWLEVRDRQGAPIHRRVVDSETLQPDTEVWTGAADRPLVRRPSDTIRSTFTAVIPDDPQGATFHIFERRAGARDDRPVELLRLNLADL